MMDDNDQLQMAIHHCQEVIDKYHGQQCLCKLQHEQLKRFLEELLQRRLQDSVCQFS